MGWKKPEQIIIDLQKPLGKKNIEFIPKVAQKVTPVESRLQFEDGSSLEYDYLVIATGPELAFDEVEGFGPVGFTQSVCTTDYAVEAHIAYEGFVKDPGPIVVGASAVPETLAKIAT